MTADEMVEYATRLGDVPTEQLYTDLQTHEAICGLLVSELRNRRALPEPQDIPEEELLP